MMIRAVEEGNRKYGYGGYIDRDGNHYPLPYNDRSVI